MQQQIVPQSARPACSTANGMTLATDFDHAAKRSPSPTQSQCTPPLGALIWRPVRGSPNMIFLQLGWLAARRCCRICHLRCRAPPRHRTRHRLPCASSPQPPPRSGRPCLRSPVRQQGKTEIPELQDVLRELGSLCIEGAGWIRTVHITSHDNAFADACSRGNFSGLQALRPPFDRIVLPSQRGETPRSPASSINTYLCGVGDMIQRLAGPVQGVWSLERVCRAAKKGLSRPCTGERPWCNHGPHSGGAVQGPRC